MTRSSASPPNNPLILSNLPRCITKDTEQIYRNRTVALTKILFVPSSLVGTR